MKVTDKGSIMWQMAVLRETRHAACKLIMASFGNYHALELITGSPLLQLPVSSSMKRPRQRSTLSGYDDRPSTPEPGEGKRSRHRPSMHGSSDLHTITDASDANPMPPIILRLQIKGDATEND